MKISLLVPIYNEEGSLEASIQSCLLQTRPFDELIYVDDCSSDRTPEILAKYDGKITVLRTPQNTGNKSGAQEYGLKFVTGDIIVTTDGDTLLDPRFAYEIEKNFKDPSVFAVCGYVRSIPYNWLTLCRAFDYAIGQRIHKLAQHYLSYIFVMPGAASAFRADAFRKHITFDHDTITEDLDFTFKMHKNHLRIVYNDRAVCYTQDPANLYSYINQMRRWYGGGWQNIVKHYRVIPMKPIRAFELSILYAEGLVFSVLLFLIPLVNWAFGMRLLVSYFITATIFASWAAWKEHRFDIALAPIPYLFLIFVNAYVYLEQFVKEVVFRRRNLVWFKPDRVHIKAV
jgi:cellulose synthase/poly-beta-1,6-N-acetylglucosamine synthase-like glycosyltransferase